MNRWASLLLLGLAIGPAAWGGAAEPAGSEPLAREEKLGRVAQVEAEGVPVSGLLAVISDKIGVPLTCRGTVADEKIAIFGPKRRVRETLVDLAALLNATWRAEHAAAGRPRYVLEVGPAAQRHEQKLARARTEALMARVDRHIRALAETPEQLARRPKNDLTRGLLSDPQYRLAAEFYTLLAPAQREQLFTRRRLNVPFGALTAGQQDGLRRIWAMVLEAEAAFAQSPEGMAIGARHLRRKPDDVERGFLRMRVQRIGGSALVGMFAGGFPAVSETVTGEQGQVGFSTSGWPIYFVKGKDHWLLPVHGNPYTGETEVQEPALPAGLTEISPQTGWLAALRTLAEQSGRPVLSDFYRMPPLNAPPSPPRPPEARPGIALLDGVCGPAGYLWWSRGATLLCRKRDWFEQRAYEVPDRWLAEVARELGPEPRLSTGVLRQVLRLSPEQAAGLFSLGERSTTDEPEALYPARALLRVIEAGDPAGRRVFPAAPATVPGGAPGVPPVLTAGVLTPLQQRLVPAYLAETDGMLGAQLPPAFRAWLTASETRRAVGPDKLRVLDMEVRWSFANPEPTGAIRLPLPVAAPSATLIVKVQP